MTGRARDAVRGALNTAAIACTVALVVLSWLPRDREIRTGLAGQFEHAAAYLATGLVAALCLRGRHGTRLVLALAGLALVLEIGQIWVPGRTAQAIDWLASTLGAGLGVGAGALVARRVPVPWGRDPGSGP